MNLIEKLKKFALLYNYYIILAAIFTLFLTLYKKDYSDSSLIISALLLNISFQYRINN